MSWSKDTRREQPNWLLKMIEHLNFENVRFVGELEDVISSTEIERDDICLVGSVVFSIRDIREHNYLDVAIRPDARESLKNGLEQQFQINSKGTIFFSEDVQGLKNRYGRIQVDDSELFERDELTEEMDGWTVARPELEFSFKTARGKEKDERDIPKIEQYALNNNLWDWSLVTLKNPYLNTSVEDKPLQKRFVESLERRGVAPTFKDGFELVTDGVLQTVPTSEDLRGWYFGDSYILFERAERGSVPVDLLLGLQRSNGEFQRWDLIVEYLRYTNSDIYGIDESAIYERVFPEGKSEGGGSIAVNKNGEIVSGLSSFAEALARGEKAIPVGFERSKDATNCTFEDLQDCGIKVHEIKSLQNLKEHLFEKMGLYFFALIWGPAYDVFDEIEEEIESNLSVRSSTDINVGDNYPDIVRQLYAVDDIDQWKVETKIGNMGPHPNVIRVLELDISDPEFREKTRTDSILSGVGANLKNSVRKQFWKDIEGYEYDIIIHTCDNYRHNRKTRQILESYR